MGKANSPREDYIAVAARQFAATGYHGTSLALLAKQAGVSKQALLHFFGTKERLYGEVLSDLAARLCAEIDAAHRPAPADHLTAYFLGFLQSAHRTPDDVRLVVRALLDSDANARKWPLKPYLDQLAALAAQARGDASPTPAEIMTWLSQMIGMIQYLAISTPAISGMYSQAMAKDVANRYATNVRASVHHFVRSRDDEPV